MQKLQEHSQQGTAEVASFHQLLTDKQSKLNKK